MKIVFWIIFPHFVLLFITESRAPGVRQVEIKNAGAIPLFKKSSCKQAFRLVFAKTHGRGNSRSEPANTLTTFPRLASENVRSSAEHCAYRQFECDVQVSREQGGRPPPDRDRGVVVPQHRQRHVRAGSSASQHYRMRKSEVLFVAKGSYGLFEGTRR